MNEQEILKILGIDPGYERIGYALLEVSRVSSPKVIASGTIKTDSKDSFANRLRVIYTEVRKLIRKLKPNGIAIEQVFQGKNVKTAVLVAHARGVIILAGQALKVPISEYPPRVVKFELHGSGNAKKEQIRYMVTQLVELPKDRMILDDEYDAIAIALVHAKIVGMSLG